MRTDYRLYVGVVTSKNGNYYRLNINGKSYSAFSQLSIDVGRRVSVILTGRYRHDCWGEIMLTLQPEEISYGLGSDDLDEYINQDPENPEGIHWAILTVGDAVYNDIPFTYDRNNKEITSLSVNIQDLAESSSSNIPENSHKEITLHYFAMDISDIPTVGEFIDVEIENPVEVDYGERVGGDHRL